MQWLAGELNAVLPLQDRTFMENPKLDECLAYNVLKKPEKWLVDVTPNNFHVFIDTAWMASTDKLGCTLPWRTVGALHHFHTNWCWYLNLMGLAHEQIESAQEHKAKADWLIQLRKRLERDFENGLPQDVTQEFKMSMHANLAIWRQHNASADEEFWEVFAKRPLLWMREFSGSNLHAFLYGFRQGLRGAGFEANQRVERVISTLSNESLRRFDDPLQIYKHYPDRLSPLLKMAGFTPYDHFP